MKNDLPEEQMDMTQIKGAVLDSNILNTIKSRLSMNNIFDYNLYT